jgi:hypothetical protein
MTKKENRIMSQLRRKGSAIVLAIVLATGLILTPTPAHARGFGGFGNYCAILAQAISYLESAPSSRLKDAVFARLQAAYAAHCGE